MGFWPKSAYVGTMRKAPRKHGSSTPDQTEPHPEQGSLSAHGLSRMRKQMDEFDDLPAEVRAALMSANEPSDQMIDVLCAMNRGGFPVADMMKVITVSNEKSGG
jgi:hypothetical protein